VECSQQACIMKYKVLLQRPGRWNGCTSNKIHNLFTFLSLAWVFGFVCNLHAISWVEPGFHWSKSTNFFNDLHLLLIYESLRSIRDLGIQENNKNKPNKKNKPNWIKINKPMYAVTNYWQLLKLLHLNLNWQVCMYCTKAV